MAEYKYALGVDPGPLPGIVGLLFKDNRLVETDVVQCSPNLCPWIVSELMGVNRRSCGWDRSVIAIEKYVIGARSSRVATPGASATTRNLIGQIIEAVDGYRCAQRSAGEVKVWATDARLQKLGLFDATNGMRHSRDAARHAIFAACKDLGVPDPLSRKAAG